MSALSDQTAAAAIVRELARATWAKAARDGEPWAEGEPRIPDPAALAAAALPVAAVQEAVACAGAVVGIEPPGTLMVAPSGPPPPMPGGLALYWVWLPVRTARPRPGELARPGDRHRRRNRGRTRRLVRPAGR